ncbi:MAG: diacylglycerol kinase [Deferrisomatales bacterium]|nr:diacylglycerol kinase [Deferrisomatales bacterium]
MKPDTWLETLNCAVEGIIHAVRTQRHMRWHSLACLALVLVTPALGVSAMEFALLCLAAAAVLVAELVNTAVESAVDLACPHRDPRAGAAKDVAAGAVLVAAFAAAAVGWLVLFPRLRPGLEGALGETARTGTVGLVAVVLAVLVSTVVLKGRVGHGRPLHGGWPSGHAAVAFALATWLALYSRDALVLLLGGVLAAMVSHSRLLQRIHSPLEVVAGVLLGVGVALLSFWLVY